LDQVVPELLDLLAQVLVIMVLQLLVLLLLVSVVVVVVVGRVAAFWLEILEEAAAVEDKDFLIILQEMQHQGKEILEGWFRYRHHRLSFINTQKSPKLWRQRFV
jgi:uncharacterized protein involved in cysteine biosynthesis